MTDRIIKESLAKGYSINSKDVLRSVERGNIAAATALGTLGGMGLEAATGYGAIYIQTDAAPGKHYRVKNDGLGVQTHSSRRFSSEPWIPR